MIVYRVALTKFCDTSGEGAKRFGGRWNLPGRAALYGSSSISSALLERLTIDPELFASERFVLYSVMELQIPDDLVHKPQLKELPSGWDAIPAENVSKEFGTKLIEKGVLCFGVPSVVDKTSMNYIINPESQDIKKISVKVYALTLDQRIIR